MFLDIPCDPFGLVRHDIAVTVGDHRPPATATILRKSWDVRSGNAVAGHSVERHAVYRREQLPVKKARHATGTERGYLVKGTLTGAVPQPGVTGEPSDAP